jgi:putative oxidoreductase
MATTESILTARRRDRAAAFMQLVGDTFRISERTIGPLVDLFIRITLAQIFFVSGVLKLADWSTALYLASNEYPVSWMNPVTAAYLGVSIELIGAVLLTLGLATRFAAFAMLVLALVIQFNYQVFDAHLFWAALLGWYVVRGAGPISLDRALAHGLGDTALPFAPAGMRASQWLTRYIAPLYRLGLRLWIALTLFVAALLRSADPEPSVAAMMHTLGAVLPVKSALIFPPLALFVCAVLLVPGLAVRLAALLLLGLTLSAQMASPQWSDDLYWLLVLALTALHGAGVLSIDEWIVRKLKQIFPQLDGKPAFSLAGLPRVVIVGAGFGGLTCAAKLRSARVQVTLLDRHNYHLFQPLLYQVATAALSPGDIASPVRGLFRESFNTRVLLGTVTGVDTERREVIVGTQHLPYDYLVLATGASHSYFGRDEWEPYAPGLKRVEDATEVRRRLLTAFERAEATDDLQERNSLLTFLIVGGGPTGVELAGAIGELARYGMEKEFRNFDPASARVILVQSGPRILPTFPEILSESAKRSLEKLGVEVLLGSKVEQIDGEGVLVSGKRIASRTVLWAAGVVASPAAKWLGVEADNAGRLKVGADLSVRGLENVFALGDTALANAWDGKPVPGLAPAAKQGGEYVAKVIRARVEGRTVPSKFVYKHLGSLATIGRKAAVVDFGAIKFSGTLAWWFWGLVHVGFLVGMRNRISVMFDWFWSYLTFQSGTRLITGSSVRPEHVQDGQLTRQAPLRAAML